MRAVIVGGGRQDPRGQAQHWIAGDVRLNAAMADELHRGEDQESAEHVEGGREAVFGEVAGEELHRQVHPGDQPQPDAEGDGWGLR